MKHLHKRLSVFLFVLLIFISCTDSQKKEIDLNKLVSPNYQFSKHFFNCDINPNSSLIELESFFSKFLSLHASRFDENQSMNVLFLNSENLSEFIISLKNYNDNILIDLISDLKKVGIENIASCNFFTKSLNGISLGAYKKEFGQINQIEILKCNYINNFNYGSFRISFDKYENLLNKLSIPVSSEYLQTDNSSDFFWINYYYNEDYEIQIINDWFSNKEASEIKDEFLNSASCIESKIYDLYNLI